MADFEKLIQKEIELDLEGIPQDQVQDAKAQVAGFVIDLILQHVGSGESPVSGEEPWDPLNEVYARQQKGGNPTPNLELEGDLLDSLGYKPTANGIAVGIMEEKQRPKADGHNHFGAYGKSKLPRRRFIPGEGQNFKPEIMEGVQEILDTFKVNRAEITERESEEQGVSISLGNLLSDESIADLILRRIGGR